MKGLSCNSAFMSQLSLEEAMCLVAECGYQGIDINMEEPEHIRPIPKAHMTPKISAQRRKAIRASKRSYGVKIPVIGAHTTLIHGAPEVRHANLQYVLEALQLASDLEVKYVVTGSGLKNFYARESQYWNWLFTSLEQIVNTAAPLGVTFILEAGSFPGTLVRNTETMQKVLSHSGLEEMGVLFDSGHYYLRGDSVAEAYRSLSGRVYHIHAKDARGNPEDFEFPPLGMGEIDFDGWFRVLAERSYAGYISVEYEAAAFGYPTDPKQILTTSKAYLDPLLSKHGLEVKR